MPASTLKYAFALPDSVNQMTGTVWNGGAQIDGGLILNWRTRLQQLLTGRLAFDVNLSGPQTRIAGKISASLFAVEARDVSGRLGPEILAAIEGVSQLACTSTGVLSNINVLATRAKYGANGQVDIGKGQCVDKAVGTVSIPAMRVVMVNRANSAVVEVRPANDANAIWGSIKVSPPANIILRVEPGGARQIPGMPNSRATIVEYNF